MHLAIDIGNTALKFALFDGEIMVVKGTGIAQLAVTVEEKAPKISRAIMASVAEQEGAAEILKKFNIPLTILSPQTALPIRNLYQTPGTLGSDRITLAVAADRIFDGAPSLVIGAGTCITYDFTSQASFYGGAISPGITMRFRALNEFTARLPYIDFTSLLTPALSPGELSPSGSFPIAFDEGRGDTYTGPGITTYDAILSGVLNGVILEINGTIEQYKRRYSGLRVALTGGDMAFLVKNLKNDIFARPDMVLEGLNYILLHHA